MTKTNEVKPLYIDQLDFIRLMHPRLIPAALIDAVKGKTFTTEEWYRYQEDQIKLENPGNHLYVLVDRDKKIQGFLWMEQSFLDGTLFVNTFSVAKQYWHKSDSIAHVIRFLRELRPRMRFNRVLWITTNARYFEKHGFKRSKNVLMEFEDHVV